MADTTTASFSGARAIRGALALITKEPVKILVFALLFVGLPDWAMTHFGDYPARTPQSVGATIGWTVAVMMVAMVSNAVLQAAVALIVQPSLADRTASLDGGRSSLIVLVFPVVALSLVTTLGILGGFVLLIIPGIILSLAWFVAVPAMVIERLGVIEAIKRSSHLTGNARGEIFGLSLAIGVMGAVIGWLIQLATTALDNATFNLIASAVAQAISGAVGAVLAVAVYQELRQSREGSPDQALEAIFA
jgi:hypothetical protein